MNELSEYWVNVYHYPSIKDSVFYSHNIRYLGQAIAYQLGGEYSKRKTLYRIHVKMKSRNTTGTEILERTKNYMQDIFK